MFLSIPRFLEFRREETPSFLTPPSALEKPEQAKNSQEEQNTIGQPKQQLPNIKVKSVDSEGVQLPLPNVSYDWKESELSSSVMPAYLPRSGRHDLSRTIESKI